jgi:hypothetical protein
MTPLAVLAGTILTASLLGDLSPFLKWALAIMVGGGVSAIVQGGTVALRAASAGATGGLANILISTFELVGSILVTVFAILLPLLGLAAVIWICFKAFGAIARSALFKKLLG